MNNCPICDEHILNSEIEEGLPLYCPKCGEMLIVESGDIHQGGVLRPMDDSTLYKMEVKDRPESREITPYNEPWEY